MSDIHRLPNPRPRIVLGETDHYRLSVLLHMRAPREAGARLLQQELSRARVVADAKLPADAVRLNSAVEYLDNEALEIGAAKVVMPHRADGPGLEAVTSPLGAALIGMRVGHTFRFTGRDGRAQTITVTRVEQAEALSHREREGPTRQRGRLRG